jgi:cytochrome bd-type quinol oxidase subunit 2
MNNSVTNPIENNCQFSNVSIIIAGILFLGLISLCLEFTKNVITEGIVTSTLIILMSLTYFCFLLLQDLYKNRNKDMSRYNYIYILLVINFIINLSSIIYFIILFFPTVIIQKINNPNVLTYLNPSVNGFLLVLFIYIFINFIVYSQIRCGADNKDIPIITIALVIFAFLECIVEILLLIMINSKLQNITDG